MDLVRLIMTLQGIRFLTETELSLWFGELLFSDFFYWWAFVIQFVLVSCLGCGSSCMTYIQFKVKFKIACRLLHQSSCSGVIAGTAKESSSIFYSPIAWTQWSYPCKLLRVCSKHYCYLMLNANCNFKNLIALTRVRASWMQWKLITTSSSMRVRRHYIFWLVSKLFFSMVISTFNNHQIQHKNLKL